MDDSRHPCSKHKIMSSRNTIMREKFNVYIEKKLHREDDLFYKMNEYIERYVQRVILQKQVQTPFYVYLCVVKREILVHISQLKREYACVMHEL